MDERRSDTTSWPHLDTLAPVSLEALGGLPPSEALYDFDRPCIFTSETSNGVLVLAYLSEDIEEEKLLRYIVATTSKATVDDLRSGVITVRDALDRGSL
jgi:hypothetical protein